MLVQLITSLFFLIPSSALKLEDDSRVISVALIEDKFEVLSGGILSLPVLKMK